VFIAGPPKKGKTWLGLGLALSVATGRPVFGHFEVPKPSPVLYVALEGSRVGIRTRLGALARGLGIDPDSEEHLDRLHLLYRPSPFDLAHKGTPAELEEQAGEIDAGLIAVDVLRSGARFKENAAEEFARVRDGLEPLRAAGRTVALLHHFGKLTDTQKERSPGERMAGTGAMYGAMDVGLLITRSEHGARRLRLEVEARDFATPDAIGVVILGTGSGEHEGFTYSDTATLATDAAAAEERDLEGEAEDLFADGVWRTAREVAIKKGGIGANPKEVLEALKGAPERFAQVNGKRVGRNPTAKPWGTRAMLEELESQEVFRAAQEHPEHQEHLPALAAVKAGVSPYRGGTGKTPASPNSQADSAPKTPRPREDGSLPDEEEVERLAQVAREANTDAAESGKRGGAA
jgi:AAA domain